MSEKQYRDKIVSITKQQGVEETARSKARGASAKYSADAAREAAKITERTTESMTRQYQRNTEAAQKKAVAEDSKAAAAAAKLGRLAADLASAEASLEREVKATARREEDKRKADGRRVAQETTRRQQAEKTHARELTRLARPTTHVVHEIRTIREPRPEMLRVLYLTANPDKDLRTEVEVRDVQEAVRRATHRDLIDILYRPAATPEDLLNGLNDIRPHVVHFSGHSGNATLLFDNASVDTPDGREVPFDLLARVLGATNEPPTLLVLNGCDTLDGAEVLLQSTPVIVAMASEITDLAATNFAARFYAAITSAQPVGAAVRQGSVALDLAGLDEGWKPEVLARDDVKLDELVLIKVPDAS